MFAGRFWPLLVLASMPGPVWSVQVPGAAEQADIRVNIRGEWPRLIELEARKAPLARVIDELAAKTGARMHYSVLPQDLVTATCAGETLQRVMECLLGPTAQLMVRYMGDESSKPGAQRRSAEIWVNGSSFAARQVSTGASTGDCASASEPKEQNGKKKSAKAKADQARKLLEMASAADPAQRADAIARLAAEGGADEATLRKTLENALSDEDPGVRAQALYGLSTHAGAEAAPYLQEALHDSNPDVRLMAVDSAAVAPQNMALLKEALGDSDETVSSLAAIKLEALARQGAAH